jgi:hypothetical protein
MMRPALMAVVLTVVVAGCGRTAPAPTSWSISPAAVPSPAGADALAPQLTATSRGAILSWIERTGSTNTLKFSERTPSGWSTPAVVTSGGNWFVSYADVPSVFRSANGTLVANWLEETDLTIEAYNLQLSYSRDNGRTWAAPFTPHHDKTTTQHGFASFFDLPGNGVGLVWLDGRAQELDTTSPEGGAMSLHAATFDASFTQLTETSVDARVCECCPTATAVTADGVLTAYRDRSAGDVRDIRIARLQNGTWQEGPIVSPDNWVIPACPVNGPALSAKDRTVAVSWFTVKEDVGHAYAAFSSDAGRTWSPAIRLDDAASQGHVDIELLDDGSALAMWTEFAGQRAQVRVRRVDASGAKSAPITLSGSGEERPTGIPRLARVGDELLFAWTESASGGPEGLQIKTAAARVPRAAAVR